MLIISSGKPPYPSSFQLLLFFNCDLKICALVQAQIKKKKKRLIIVINSYVKSHSSPHGYSCDVYYNGRLSQIFISTKHVFQYLDCLPKL